MPVVIDSEARVHPDAVLGKNVAVGPWTIIEAGVEIGDNTEIGAHVIVSGRTRIGANNKIFSFCSIGADPQDKKFEPHLDSRLEIGDNNTIREYCSINRGTPGGGGVTRLGDDNWIMAYCHIAHDCLVGDKTIFANNATLAGHVEIHDHVILGGFTGVHQFCRIGESSFSAIAAIIVKDVPPFMIVKGNTASARAINREGLCRRGFAVETIATIKQAYKILYRQGRILSDALSELDRMASDTDLPEIARFASFIRASKRGIVR